MCLKKNLNVGALICVIVFFTIRTFIYDERVGKYINVDAFERPPLFIANDGSVVKVNVFRVSFTLQSLMGEIYTAQQPCGGDMTRVTLLRKADRVSFVVPLPATSDFQLCCRKYTTRLTGECRVSCSG